MDVLLADEIPPLPRLPPDLDEWFCPRSCVTATYNASLGHGVDLKAFAKQVSYTRRWDPLRLPSLFKGLQYGKARLGNRVSRKQASHRFPNQLSLRFAVGRQRVHVMLFANGSMTLTGLRDHATAYQALRALVSLPLVCPTDCTHLRPPAGLHGVDHLPAVRISMYKMVFSLPVELDIPAFAALMPSMTPMGYHVESEYGLTRSTALKVYLTSSTHYAANPKLRPCTYPTGTCDRTCYTSFSIFRTGRIMVSGRSIDYVEEGFRELTRLITSLYDSIVEPAFDALGLVDEAYRSESDDSGFTETTGTDSDESNE
jgi:hypothetical protein